MGDNYSVGTAPNDVTGTLDTGSAATEAQVRRLIALRHSRHRLFEENLFFDPAWDMLLELYAAKLAGKLVSRAELCVLSRTPLSTALRWVELLERNGWVARKTLANDDDRCLLTLSQKALVAMAQFIADYTCEPAL